MRRMVRSLLITLAIVVVVVGGGLALVLSHGSSGGGNRGPATPAISRTASPLPPTTSAPAHLSRVLCANWAVVPLAPSDGIPDLDAVAALAANDVWAAGADGDTSGVILHWDGATWTRSPTPSLSGTAGFRSIAAVSATDIWAVGSIGTSRQSSLSLIEHWNGSQWSVVSSPDEGTAENILTGIAVVNGDDIWAVGIIGLTNSQPLMLHWNGTSWRDLSGPSAPYASELSGVAAVSSNDVWAVGSSGGSGPQTLAEHWNGRQWRIMPAPQGSTSGGALNSVVARAANDVWAVGYSIAKFPIGTSLTEHWNGSAWQVINSPSPDTQGVNPLLAVTAVAGSSILWAVGVQAAGEATNGTPAGIFLVEEWTGSAWRVVSVPSGPGDTGYLYGVAATPDGDIWVVGGAGLTMVHAGAATRGKLNCPPV